MKAEVLVSLGVMVILMVGFLLLKQPYGILLAVLLGIMDFIPIIGSGTVMVPGPSSSWPSATGSGASPCWRCGG